MILSSPTDSAALLNGIVERYAQTGKVDAFRGEAELIEEQILPDAPDDGRRTSKLSRRHSQYLETEQNLSTDLRDVRYRRQETFRELNRERAENSRGRAFNRTV